MSEAESFIEVLSAYGRQYPPSLVFAEDDAGEWARSFRAAVDSLFGPVPARVPLAVDEVEVLAEPDHSRHVLRVRVSEVSTLVAYLLIPHDLAAGETRPGLIVSHGHARYGIDSICGVRGMEEGDNALRAYALSAVRAGYVVLAPAWWGWAGRDGHLARVGARDRCNVIQMAAGMYGLNVLALHIQDGQAAIDVLAARPEVDASRIGCLGNSYGGRTTMWLTIYDERIRACVPSGCMNTFRERSLKLSSCGIQYFPGLLQHGDVPELFALIAPRPMQLQCGAQDPLITPGDRDSMIETVRRAYAAHDADGQLDYVLHPGGHLLVWDEAEPFLRRHLDR